MEKLQPIRIFLINFFYISFLLFKKLYTKKIKKKQQQQTMNKYWPPMQSFYVCLFAAFPPTPFFHGNIHNCNTARYSLHLQKFD